MLKKKPYEKTKNLKKKILPYSHQCIDSKDIDEVVKALKSDFITTGPKIEQLEHNFSDYVNSNYAVAVSSGTAALHIACLASGLKDGEELITSPITFAASANCALYCGAKPVFVDIKDNGLINENKIEEKITKKTRIVMPVHYGGLPCNIEKIKKISEQNNILVIEDACHALGSKYKDNKIGSCKYSDMAVFSFHPAKHITTGEGGMITTNSKEIYEKLLMLRSHGITKNPKKFVNKSNGSWYHEMQYLGFNYRITDFQCALGISQLKKIGYFIKKRREIAKKYNDAFDKSKEIQYIKEEKYLFNSYHLYPIKVKDWKTRSEIFNYLKTKDIFCQVHYIPVYMHPYYKNLGYTQGLCPMAEEFYQREISLPLFPSMTNKEINKVIENTFSALKEK